ncbi:hypothetical protein F5X99DRAFT_410538 [Biscogniauxia marginata]|nr:hypothetical protein F5X99DRAFT_410538 [Biscogniauxia marginata]
MNNILISLIVLVAASVLPARAHWTYNRLIVNGEVAGEPWQYVRYVPNAGDPLQDVNSTGMRCNANGGSGTDTQTCAVRAGDELGFGLKETFGHPGIQQADAWAAHNIESFRFALPVSTPSPPPHGEYLLRAEGLALHAAHKVAGAVLHLLRADQGGYR